MINFPSTQCAQTQLELAQVLSDIDQFDPLFEDPQIENPNNGSEQMPETISFIPGIICPLNTSQPPNISTIPSQDFFIQDIPSTYESTPPNTLIIISNSPTPTDLSEDPLRTLIYL